MEKKSKSIQILVFIAALFFGLYIIIEFSEDFFAVAGAGAVLLIASYFLIDKIEKDANIKEEEERIKKEAELEYLKTKIAVIEKIQRASYIVLKNADLSSEKAADNNIGNDKFLELLDANLNELKDIKQIQLQTNNTLKSSTKAVLKYNREDSEKIVDMLKTKMELLSRSVIEFSANVVTKIDEEKENILEGISKESKNIKTEIKSIDLDNIQVQADTSKIEEKYDELSQAMLQNIVTITESIDSMNEAINDIGEKFGIEKNNEFDEV